MSDSVAEALAKEKENYSERDKGFLALSNETTKEFSELIGKVCSKFADLAQEHKEDPDLGNKLKATFASLFSCLFFGMLHSFEGPTDADSRMAFLTDFASTALFAFYAAETNMSMEEVRKLDAQTFVFDLLKTYKEKRIEQVMKEAQNGLLN